MISKLTFFLIFHTFLLSFYLSRYLIVSKGLTIVSRCVIATPAALSNNRECFQNCLRSEFLLFLFFFFLVDGKICESEFSPNKDRGSRFRQFDRIVECLAGSLSIYIYKYYICVYRYRPVYLVLARKDLIFPFPRSLFNILMSPFTLIMSLHLVTADARYSLSWGSLLLDEPVTRSLFVILILLSRGSVHSGIKRASSRSLRRDVDSGGIVTIATIIF